MPTHDEDLLTWALRWAKANGDTDPTCVRYVQCPTSVADRIIDPENPEQKYAQDDPVDLVVMEGDFVGHMASPPLGAQLPRGPHLHILFDHRTHRKIGWGMGKEPYDVENSGLPVITLKP